MKYLYITTFIFISLFLGACQTIGDLPGLDGTLTPINEPENKTLTLKPSLNSNLNKRLIYFLVDNSPPVTPKEVACGELGKENINYVDFVTTNIFEASIPVEYSENLYVGIGVFDQDYKSLQTPVSIKDFSENWKGELPESKQSTFYTKGISGALSNMPDTLGVQERYLVIVTDGYFTNEGFDVVNAELNKIALTYKDAHFNIYIALLCNKFLAKWSQMNSISNVKVGSLEDITGELINNNLKGYFPSGSSVILSNKSDQSISVAGYHTNVNFKYWSADTSKNLTILGVNTIYDKSIRSLSIEQDDKIYPLPGCVNHIYEIHNAPKDNWFLFVQPQTSQDLEVILKSQKDKEIEIVNNDSMIFDFDIQEKVQNKNWENLKDCFSITLNEVSNYPLFATPISCKESDHLCVQLSLPQPQNSKREIDIKVVLISSKDDEPNPIMESEAMTIPIKFKAKYLESSVPSPISSGIVQQDYRFSNVISQPRIYLVTNLSTDKVLQRSNKINKQFQSLGYWINNKVASEIVPDQHCQLSELASTATYVCVLLSSSGGNLEYIFSISYYEYIVSELEFNQIFFVWNEENDGGTKKNIIKCEIGNGQCDEEITELDIEPRGN